MLTSKAPISVALVEHHEGLRETLSASLRSFAEIDCVGIFGSAEEAIHKIPLLQPRLVVIDLHLPDSSGLRGVHALSVLQPKPHILLLAEHQDDDTLFQGLCAGGNGVLRKPIRARQLFSTIQDLCAGMTHLSPSLARRFRASMEAQNDAQHKFLKERLDESESRVLYALSEGLLPAEISQRIGISKETIQLLLGGIHTKLHMQTRSQSLGRFPISPSSLFSRV